RVYWNRIRSRWDVFSTFEPGKLLYSSRSMVLREVTKPDIWYEGLYHSSDPGMSRRLAKWALDNAKAGEDAPYRVAMPA
ncbi:MAG: hypothetical protein GWN58_28300, partial [Anaerolineae bacterium]|nr:hypothetical protein [Anaerolineae bacterium]